MSLTYGDLPTKDVCAKLTQVSFASPKKNLDVYKLISKIREYQAAFDNERDKLLERVGTPDENKHGVYNILGKDNVEEYNSRIKELTEQTIDESLPNISLTEQDFSDENCQYPRDKRLWLNASEIGTLLDFFKKCQ